MTLLSALVAATVIAQPQESPQRKAVLPNGTSLYAERVENAKVFFLHLSVSALGEPEKEGQQGHRHLIEHIVAKGRKKGLDASLESRGLYLTADTTQDGVRFEIEGAASEFAFAIAQLADLLEFPTVTQAEVERELQVIKEEQGVRAVSSRLYAALYETGLGSPDQLGDFEDLAKATPDALKASYAALFVPSRMSVAVLGGIDPDKAMEAMNTVFAALSGPPRPSVKNRVLVTPLQEGFVKATPGCARGVLVGSLSQPDTIAVMAAALALASEIQGAQVVYTPSPIGGFVALVHPARMGLDDADRLIAGESARLFKYGRASVRLWAESSDRNLREKARTLGQMLSVENYFRIEDHLRRSNELQQAAFNAALQKFNSRACVRVGGVR